MKKFCMGILPCRPIPTYRDEIRSAHASVLQKKAPGGPPHRGSHWQRYVGRWPWRRGRRRGINAARYVYSSGNGVHVDLANHIATGGDAQGDTLVKIENLVGSWCADTLQGDDGVNTLWGGGGGDHLEGRGGNDVLYGESGNDFIDGGAGRDSIQGGPGDDVLFGGNDDDLGLRPLDVRVPRLTRATCSDWQKRGSTGGHQQIRGVRHCRVVLKRRAAAAGPSEAWACGCGGSRSWGV